MISLSIHSRLNIRKNDESRLSLGCNLELVADSICNTTPAQEFEINPDNLSKSDITGFTKYRGILIIDNRKLIFEMIAAAQHNKKDLPIIIRLWGSGVFKEYLFSDNAIDFRCNCLNMEMPTSAITMQLAEFIGSQYEGGILYPESMEVIGLGEKPFLIPNVTQAELNNSMDNFSFTNYPSETIDNFIRELFDPLTSDEDIVKLTGILMGEIPHMKKKSHFEAPVLEKQTIMSEIQSPSQYGALRELLKIPFDDFEIDVDVVIMRAVIDKLSSTDGMYEIVNNDSQHMIELQCLKFVMQYFQRAGNNSIFDNNGVRYRVKNISIVRTINDYITLTIFTDNAMFVRKFDLILLSTISPVIDAY